MEQEQLWTLFWFMLGMGFAKFIFALIMATIEERGTRHRSSYEAEFRAWWDERPVQIDVMLGVSHAVVGTTFVILFT